MELPAATTGSQRTGRVDGTWQLITDWLPKPQRTGQAKSSVYGQIISGMSGQEEDVVSRMNTGRTRLCKVRVAMDE